MDKFILIMFFCSLTEDSCMAGHEHTIKFADYYSCMVTGYSKSIRMLEDIESEGVNEYQITMRHDCIENKFTEL